MHSTQQLDKPDPANDGRVARADAAVQAADAVIQAHLAQMKITPYDERDALGYLVDVLTDLQHWAGKHKICYIEADIISRYQYREDSPRTGCRQAN